MTVYTETRTLPDLLHKTALSGSQIKPPALPEVSNTLYAMIVPYML